MADLVLKQVGDHTFYIPSPTNIGVYIQQDSVYLIDSGNDKDAGRKVRQLLESRDWRLEMICNTHSNADHIGGNAYLQSITSCRIGASQLEKPFIEFPALEPSYLWGGFPHSAIENKFLKAKPSRVTDVLTSESHDCPAGMEIIELPGHFFQMIGFKTPDEVMFLADALFPASIIEKYHIFYIYDVAAFLGTLRMLKKADAKLFIPSHCDPVTDLDELIAMNENKVVEVAGAILDICSVPKSPDEIIAATCRRYSLTMNAAQYVLIGSTVRSYIAYLQKEGKLSPVVDRNIYAWVSV